MQSAIYYVMISYEIDNISETRMLLLRNYSAQWRYLLWSVWTIGSFYVTSRYYRQGGADAISHAMR